MQNLEAVALKLAELWPFNDFSKIITDSLTHVKNCDRQSDLYYPLVADKNTFWSNQLSQPWLNCKLKNKQYHDYTSVHYHINGNNTVIIQASYFKLSIDIT